MFNWLFQSDLSAGGRVVVAAVGLASELFDRDCSVDSITVEYDFSLTLVAWVVLNSERDLVSVAADSLVSLIDPIRH